MVFPLLLFLQVQSKYGVGVGQTNLLVMVPSHIPQCVEIFNFRTLILVYLVKIETILPFYMLNDFWNPWIMFGNCCGDQKNIEYCPVLAGKYSVALCVQTNPVQANIFYGLQQIY